MKVYTLVANVRGGDDWAMYATLGAFTDPKRAEEAFKAWVAGEGPRQLDPAWGSWGDGHSHYGYEITECELDRWSAHNILIASEDLEREYPDDEDDE